MTSQNGSSEHDPTDDNRQPAPNGLVESAEELGSITELLAQIEHEANATVMVDDASLGRVLDGLQLDEVIVGFGRSDDELPLSESAVASTAVPQDDGGTITTGLQLEGTLPIKIIFGDGSDQN